MTARLPVRLIGWAVALALLALPVVGVMQGWFASESWPIRTLTVQAEYRHVSAAEVRAAVLPHIGHGFFATDLDAVQESVARLPWVQSAEARKRWPDTLVLRVHERQPFAHWNGAQLIDRHGGRFSVPHGAAVGGLPSLSGPDPRMSDVVAFFLHARSAFDGSGVRITGAHLSSRDSWSLDLDGSARLVIGSDHPEQRLQRFLDVYPRLAAAHAQRFTYADLRYTNGFALRWPEPAAPDTAASGGAPRT